VSDIENRLTAHLQTLVGERHPFSAAHHLLQAESYLSRQLRECGLAVDLHPFQAWGQRYHNVVATVAGGNQAPPLIVAAHFDTVEQSPGADDNASGLAVLLEVARLVQKMDLVRPVRFIAFNLEEENLLGSSAYATELRASDQEILGAIVLECVGHAKSETGTQQRPPHVPIDVPTTGDFLAVVGNEKSQHMVAALMTSGSRAVPTLKMIPLVVPGRGEHLPDTRRSDHAAFWDHGFPAVMLTDTANFRNPHYHRSTDTIETLNLKFLANVTNAVAAAVMDLAGRPT
jgi:Zn-dependent M28 family amino/carboxypeptidase